MAPPTPDRFAEPAGWILAALGRGPSGAAALYDTIRSSARRIGPGTLIATLARLERADLVEPLETGDRLASGDGPMYRLASQSRARDAWIES